MFKPRLQRLKLLYTTHPLYFLTLCTQERVRILASPAIHESFIEFAREASARGVFVGRYVIMPDHLHLFAAFDFRAPSLSVWIKSLKNSLSKTFREMKLPEALWQKGFFDHVLRSEESYERQWLYVEQNPVRAGLVRQVRDWPYQGEIHHLTL